MNNGYVIVAENTPKTNYLACAEALAYSMKRVMPSCSITLLSNDETSCKYFDQIIPLKPIPSTDQYKITNDVQAYWLSPYEYTIKLEADMFIPRSIEHWWDVLKERDMVVSTTIRDFKGNISDCRVYRRFIDDNGLPDVYNAVTYFKKSDTAKQFFQIVQDVAENWKQYKSILKCNPSEEVSTDWAYAVASHLVGVENTTLPGFEEMSMVHMKKFINGLPSEDWTNTLIYEILPHAFRVNTYVQSYPFHYHTKTFYDRIRERMYA